MKKYITEFIGTLFLVLTIGLVVNGKLGVLAPLPIGAVLMVMVYAGGQISGAHYNPAVTLAVFIRGRVKMMDAVGYMVAQLAAAALASFIVKYFLPDDMPKEVFVNDHAIKALIAEFLGTFALAYVVLNVATSKNNAGNSFYGIAIGFTVLAMAYAFGNFSGGAFNPAVAIGLGLMKLVALHDLWIYAVGCFGGGLIAGLLFLVVNPDDK